MLFFNLNKTTTTLAYMLVTLIIATTACTNPSKKPSKRKPKPNPNSTDSTTGDAYPVPVLKDPAEIEAEAVATLRAKLKSGAWNDEHIAYDAKKIQTFAYTFSDTHVTLVSTCSFYADATFKFITTTAPYSLTSQTLAVTAPANASITYKDIACEANIDTTTWHLKLEGKTLQLSTPQQVLSLKQLAQ